ncbi:MAG: helix-turn-helix domain-containing protein [Verrucomicrobiaceae bacterium]
MSIPDDTLHNDSAYESLIGERLKHYRLELNINQTELAEKAGIARRTITSVENGQGCTLNTLIRLLKALNKIELLQPLLDPPPLTPEQIRLRDSLRQPTRKNASKPRKKDESKPWVWGDEQ